MVADCRQDLVLVPGLLCNQRLWHHQLTALADQARIWVVDSASHDNIAAIAAQVLESAPARFALAGLSLGGYICFEIMRQAPSRVTRLALLDTSPRADDDTRKSARRAAIHLALSGRFTTICRLTLPGMIHPGRIQDTSLIRDIRTMSAEVGGDAFLRQQNAIMARADSLSDLPAYRLPTLVLCGRQDKLTPLADHQLMARRIGGSVLKVVENCGHLAPMERPREVTAALRVWLTGQARRHDPLAR
jgi:pimeloyl-ACP methyl ester carboxylesterase